MVRYRSRLGGKTPTKAKRRTKTKKVSIAIDPPADKLGDFSNDPGPVTAPVGGGLSTGGALGTGGALSSGGALGTGGGIDVDSLGYPEIIHALGAMTGDTYHTLQGVASAFLPESVHPLKAMVIRDLGGSFEHPGNVSKVATRDILRAPNSRKLSSMLYMEWLDRQKGHNTGGGLFDSLKNLFRKGKKKAASGLKKGLAIGDKFNSALIKGREIAQGFQAPLSKVSKRAGRALERGLTATDKLQRTVQRGLNVGRSASSALSEVAKATNP